MKFKSVVRGGLVMLGIALLVHLLLHVAVKSLQDDRLPPAVSGGLLFIALVIVVVHHYWKGGVHGRTVLQLTRKGIDITLPDGRREGLAWRMIESAELERETSPRWRLRMKNGNQTFIQAQAFTGEQWKKLSGQLDRAFRKRKIPIRVQGAGADLPS